jgi:hypothetical protein
MDNLRDGHVELQNGKVYYKLLGKPDETKKLVVCVHGIGSYSYCWNYLSESLVATGRYVVLSFGKICKKMISFSKICMEEEHLTQPLKNTMQICLPNKFTNS